MTDIRFKVSKIINDPVHGSIRLTDLESKIIETRAFMRLHGIKQQSLAYMVFPGAVHTRFSHSIGTMHIASQMISNLLAKLKREDFENLFSNKTRNDIVKIVRLTALLHDIGHGPFSHTSEEIMRTVLSFQYKRELKQAMKITATTDVSKLPIHEYYSYKMITDKNGEIYKIMEQEKMDQKEIASLLFLHNPRNSVSNRKESEKRGHNILHNIVSSDIDADRLDYLMRDSYFSGVRYGEIDLDRILNNIEIRKHSNNSALFDVAFHSKSLPSLEDMLDSRYKMYKTETGHHLVVAYDELLKGAIMEGIIKGDINKSFFYWKTFQNGRGTDGDILAGLYSSISKKCKTNYYRGIIHRSYAPISLIKRIGIDHGRFLGSIQEKLGRQINPDNLKKALIKFQDECPVLDIGDKKVRTFCTIKNRNPYTPKSGAETIYLFPEQDGVLRELTSVSDYVSAINETWKSLPSFYISYAVGGTIKKDAQKIYSEVRERVIDILSALC